MSVQNYILSSVPAWIQKYTISKNELTLYVYPEYIVPFRRPQKHMDHIKQRV